MTWIPIEKHKPPVGESIMLWSPEGGTAEGMMNSAGEFIQYRWSSRVKATHWAFKDLGPGEEKTADQMFRELGYEKIQDPIMGDIIYGKTWNYKEDTITEHIRLDDVDEDGYADKIRWETGFKHWGDGILTFEEILACAQLIREMEKENEV